MTLTSFPVSNSAHTSLYTEEFKNSAVGAGRKKGNYFGLQWNIFLWVGYLRMTAESLIIWLGCFKEKLHGQLNITTCEWSQSLWWSLLVWLVSKFQSEESIHLLDLLSACLQNSLPFLLDRHRLLISTKLKAQLRLMGESWVYRYLVVNLSIGRIQNLTWWWRLMMKLLQFNVWSKFNGNTSSSSSDIYWQTDHAACTAKIMVVVSFIQ